MKGGKKSIFLIISLEFVVPLENSVATKIANVETTTNDPGWSTITAVSKPSFP